MNCKELNKINKNYVRNSMKKDLEFEWEDKDILNEIIKKIDNLHHYSSDPESFISNNDFLYKINKLFRELFERKLDNDLFLSKLEVILNQIITEYPTLSYQFRYNIDLYKRIISNSNRLIIRGYGGIGKSYFVYKLEEELNKYNLNHLCLYGKYNDYIPDNIFEEITRKRKEFYFVIDALNEFCETEQQRILNKLQNLKRKKKINIIVTYRTSSLKVDKLEQLRKILINEYEFKGVEFESSLLKLIELFGLNSIRFIDVIDSNNPYNLIMLREILSSTKLLNEEIGSVVQATYIMERYIKLKCGLDNWKIIKDIGIYMFENEVSSISATELKNIAEGKYDDFVSNMVQNNFMHVYLSSGINFFMFSIQSLSDYIIARPLFDMLKDKSKKEIIKLINNKLDKMYTLHNIFALIILDKFKDNNLRQAIDIIFNSDIFKEFDIQTFRKVKFNNKQIKLIQKLIIPKDYITLFKEIGGYANRPFNCKNFLNKILFENKKILHNLLVNYSEGEYIFRLKNIIYVLPFLNDELDVLEEYFYYSFWLMSVSNDRIRHLAMKVVYDICYKNKRFCKFLIDNCSNINELYIRKAIIHILTKLPKTKKTTNFINNIFYDKNEIDAEIIWRCSIYLKKNSEFQLLNKKNLNLVICDDINVDSNLDLNQVLVMADLYDSSLLKFDRHLSGNILSITNNFIINKNTEIKYYNEELLKKFSCIKKDGYCKYSLIKDRLTVHLEPLEIIELEPKRMFILYQEIFKDICQKYSYDYLIQDKFDDHFNKFENSLLKKILLLSQDILLGSLMSNYYTNYFSIYNDDCTLGYKNYSYIKYNDESFYLTSPIAPYNEYIDRLNDLLVSKIELYKNNNYNWYKSKKKSIDVCKKIVEPVTYNKEEWSFIGGRIHFFVLDYINVSYSCYMAFNPSESFVSCDDVNRFTIDNDSYYGNVKDYIKEKNCKNMSIPNFESHSEDIRESYLFFPSPQLIKYLNLKYDFITSSWIDEDNNPVILCDNNSKSFYKSPIVGAIYIRTDILNKLKEKNKIVYWCYTDKSYKNYGMNKLASLHLEFDSNGNLLKEINAFENREFTDGKVPQKCKKCKYGIYNKEIENLDFTNYFEILKENGYIIDLDDE